MTDKNPITQSIDWLVECGWSKAQATNLAGAIKADTPEKLWEVAPLWLEHCGDSMKYVNDMLGSVAMGLIEVTQGEDGEATAEGDDDVVDAEIVDENEKV